MYVVNRDVDSEREVEISLAPGRPKPEVQVRWG